MRLSTKQKKQVKQAVKEKSVSVVAKEFGVKADELEAYLVRVWGREKFERIEVAEKSKIDEQGKKTEVVSKNPWKNWQKRVANWQFKTWFQQERGFIGLLVFLTLALYLPFINNAFLSDDIFGIVDETRFGTAAYIWENPFVFIRPLLYSIINSMFGKVPFAFRLLNITSHLLMVGAVYALVQMLMGKLTARVAAILTAIHPIMLEAVIWISAGAHSQYSFFVVLAMILYVLGREKRQQRYFWWAGVNFIVALLFSEKAIIFPVILMAYEFVRSKQPFKWWLLPFLGVSIVWGLRLVVEFSPRADSLQSNFSSVLVRQHPLVQVPVAIANYVGLVFWPDGYTIYHSELSYSNATYVGFVFLLLAIVGMVIFGWYQARFKRKTSWGWVAFWLSWFVISLGLTLLPTGVSWVVAERYSYLASIGLFVLVGFLFALIWQRYPKSQLPLTFIGMLLVTGLMVRSYVRANAWRDQDSLWLATARLSPNSAQNNNNLGDLYARQGDFEQAIFHFSRAMELSPQYVEASYNLGSVYRQIGDLETARKIYLQTLEWRPNLTIAYLQLADMALQEENYTQANEIVQQGLAVNPGDPQLLQAAQVVVEVQAQAARAR